MDGKEKYSEGKLHCLIGGCEISSDQWFDSEGLVQDRDEKVSRGHH